ncbi:MAG: winged helix-turn-helix domain-containing protein, partial [Candidatus Peribacteraceae bacterium]|nr:winged helix-turn-helix domain-containing protein [Candidatus Peribacteraceae bacterium]
MVTFILISPLKTMGMRPGEVSVYQAVESGPLTASEIASAIGQSLDQVRQHLSRLMKNSYVVSDGEDDPRFS